jgi:hypothetical protein
MLGSEVHPTDSNSAPYNFSSTTSPLLNNTARALNLPARSHKSYLSVFGLPTSSSSVMSPASRSSSSTSTSHTATPPLDDKYTGHILVSGYNISYVLPKEFPPRFGEDSAIRVSTFSAAKMRRGSVGERNNMHFMAGLDLWVPYVCRPPKAPFLVRRFDYDVNFRLYVLYKYRYPSPFRVACLTMSSFAFSLQTLQRHLLHLPLFLLPKRTPAHGSLRLSLTSHEPRLALHDQGPTQTWQMMSRLTLPLTRTEALAVLLS